MTEKENSFLTKERRRYLFIIATLIVLNIVSFSLFAKNAQYDSENENYVSNNILDNLKFSLLDFLVVCPILSLLLATLISLFPNKNLKYRQKLPRVFTFVWLIVTVLMTIMHILISFDIYRTPEPECDCMPKTKQDSIAAFEAAREALIEKQKDSLKIKFEK